MSDDPPMPCGVCGLLLQGERHESPGDCIRGLRKSIVAQRTAVEFLSFEMSTRYLAALEELVLRPDVGIPYHVRVPGPSGDVVQLPSQQVSGVFASILRKYKEMGDWSPLKERDTKISDQARLIDLLVQLLPALLMPQAMVVLHRDHVYRLEMIGELATRLGVHLPDLMDC